MRSVRCIGNFSALVGSTGAHRRVSVELIPNVRSRCSHHAQERNLASVLRLDGASLAFGEAVSMNCKMEVGPDHVLMGWMVRHCAWVVNNFQVKGTGRTPYRSIRGNDCTGEVVPFGNVCLGRNHSEDGPN